MPFIDAHVHVWTPDTAHYPLAAGFKRENMSPRSFTPDELFKHTKPANVDRINLIQMSFYGFEMPWVIPLNSQAPNAEGAHHESLFLHPFFVAQATRRRES